MKKGRYKRRSLRVALVYRGEVLQDRLLEPGQAQDVSLGEEARNALRMPTTHLDEGFVLLQPSARSPGRHTLRLGAHFTGKLRINGRNCHLNDPLNGDTLLNAQAGPSTTVTLDDGARISQPTVEVEVGPGDWGMLHVGPYDVIFQYVQPATSPARHPGWLREAAQHLSSPIGIGVLVGLMAQSSLMFWASTAEEPSLQQLVERSVEDRQSAQSVSAPTIAAPTPCADAVATSLPITAQPIAAQPLTAPQSTHPHAWRVATNDTATSHPATLASDAGPPSAAPLRAPPVNDCARLSTPADALTTTYLLAADALNTLWHALPPTPPQLVKLWTAQAAGLTQQGLDSGRHAQRAHRHAQPAHDGHRSRALSSPQIAT